MGTAFFMGVDAGYDDQSFPYLVTARHCAKDPDLGIADEMHVRLNTKTGGSVRIPVSPGDWWLHPTADVAVMPFVPDEGTFHLKMWGIQGCATNKWMKELAIGPGDDVFITGLLIHHPGTTRNMPIVRLGSIAGLPEEPIRLSTGDDVVALLEVRSIGGLSGSPVFVHLPFWRDTERGSIFVAGDSKAGSGGEYRLLGVMHGFFPVGANDPDNVSAGNEDLNTGIAVVALADRILDFINDPPLVAARATYVEKLRLSAVPKTASATTGSPDYEAGFQLTQSVESLGLPSGEQTTTATPPEP